MLTAQKNPAQLGFFVLLEDLATRKRPLFILANQVLPDAAAYSCKRAMDKQRKSIFDLFQNLFFHIHFSKKNVLGIETAFLRLDCIIKFLIKKDNISEPC